MSFKEKNNNKQKENKAACSEQWGSLVSALIDGELSQSDEIKVREHIENCPSCEAFAKTLNKIKGVTDKMSFTDLPDARWRQYWTGIYNRIERGIGWFFLSIGAILLLIFGAFELLSEFIVESDAPIILKIGVGTLVVGFIVLLVSVSREAFFRYRGERYKEVDI